MFSGFAPAFPSITEVRAGQGAQRAVTRGIHEARGLEAAFHPCFRVADRHGFDVPIRGRGGGQTIRGEERELRLCLNDRELTAILVAFGRGRIASAGGADLGHDTAQLGIGADKDASAEVHADFGAVAPAKACAVVDQRDAKPETGRSDGRAKARNAGADDDEVVSLGLRGGLDAAVFASEGVKGFHRVGEFGMSRAGEDDGVAPGVKTREVVQGHRDFPLGEREAAGLLPSPALAVCAKDGGQRLPIQRDLETARGLGRPFRGPVARADPNVPFAGLRQERLRGCVGDGMPHAMGQQEW